MGKHKREFIQLIPGFYADSEGHVFLNTLEFLKEHNLPDTPAVRTVVWEEARQIFEDVEISEITD
jgi:hypothetical protein